MKKQFTLLLIGLLSLSSIVTKANTYYVSSNGGGTGSLQAALLDVNANPSTNDNPHVIEICTGGDYYISPAPTNPVIINGPKDMSLHVHGLYFNIGQSLQGKHFWFNYMNFDDNHGSAFGSALMSSTGGATTFLDHCHFYNNDAQYQSGGVFNNGDSIIISNCTFNNNTTTNAGGEGGGAVFNNGGYMTITNCTFSNNSSVSQSGTGGGGAVKNHAGGYMLVTNCTFYNNSSASNGGGLSNNGSGTCYISNNIFVGNSATNGPDIYGTFTSANGHNLIGDASGATLNGTTTGNVSPATAANVLNTTLADNGRYTYTHDLVVGSPAIDAADGSVATAADERGFTRNGTADMGANEYNGTNICANFVTTINPPAPGCVAVTNYWSSTSTGGAAIFSSYWYDGTNLWCGDTLEHYGSGTFVYTITDVNYCVAKDTFTVNYNLPSYSYNFTICAGDTLFIKDSTLTEEGTYTFDYGCDSVVDVQISFTSVPNIEHTVSICNGSSITVGNHTYNATGDYTDYFPCDSVVVTHLTVTPLTLPTVSVTQALSCLGSSDAEVSLTTSTADLSVEYNATTYIVGAMRYWADTVLDVSREYNTSGSWSAEQLLGAPNTYPNYGDIGTSWTPESYGDQRDYVVLGYNTPVMATGIEIYETDAPGLVDTVYVHEAGTNNWILVYTGTPAQGPPVATIFTVSLNGNVAVDAVRVEFATDLASDWMEVDAIGLTVSGNSSISGLSSGVHNYTSTDNYGCTYNGSFTIADGAPLAIAITPGDTAICAGKSAILNVAGASTYNWSNSGSGSSITVTPSGTTVYSVTGTDNNGCMGSDTITVTINQLPTINLNLPQTPFCVGMDTIVSLQGGSPAGGSYTGSIVVNNAINLLNAVAGTYQVTYTYTDANGCTNSGIDSVSLAICDGITEADAANWEMSVYPNPTAGKVTITINGLYGQASLQLYNSTGQLLLTNNIEANGKLQQGFDLSSLPAGLYQVQLQQAGKNITKRLVITQ